jgi:hypothetical protein
MEQTDCKGHLFPAGLPRPHRSLTRRQKEKTITLKRIHGLATIVPVRRHRSRAGMALFVDWGLVRGFTFSIDSSDSLHGRSNAATISGPMIGNMNTLFVRGQILYTEGSQPVVFELAT